MLWGKMYPNMMYLLLKGRLEISTGSRVIKVFIFEVRAPFWVFSLLLGYYK